jgi:heptosyltransferase III
LSKNIDLNGKTILISRTDSIGDVVLTLPLCVYLKEKFPSCKIIFLGSNYTKSIVSLLLEIDDFISWNEVENLPLLEKLKVLQNLKIDVCLHVFPKKEIASIVKKAKIPVRIGTSHRAYHLLTCNIRLNFTRKNSKLHESQLNFELLKPFDFNEIPSLEEISENLTQHLQLPKNMEQKDFFGIKNAIILHPKSQGSALEWPIEKYINLAYKLLLQGEKVVFTGTENEGEQFRKLIPKNENCFDLTGKMTLDELIVFIVQSKALIACSTGPLHLAGILNIKAIGLFSSRKPIHPGRWKPLGKNVHVLEYDSNCKICKKGKNCSCIQNITVERVQERIAI